MPTLIIMRHAKSSWSTDHVDHDRPLNGRGQRQGFAAGQWLLEHRPMIDRVLCSTAQRTRQTLERVLDAGVSVQEVSFHEEIYEAAAGDMVSLLRHVAEEDRTVLLLGHYPGVEMLVKDLTGRAVDDRFVTSGMAVLSFEGAWARLGQTAARMEAFIAPGRD